MIGFLEALESEADGGRELAEAGTQSRFVGGPKGIVTESLQKSDVIFRSDV